MTAAVIDGTKLAERIRSQVAADVAALVGIDPTLALVLATADESAAWYVRAIRAAAAKVGVFTRVSDLGADASGPRIAAELAGLAGDPGVHGVILQMPLPAGVSAEPLVSAIPPGKDVDGANPLSAGRLMAGQRAFPPATAAAVMELLGSHGAVLSGAHAVVVGRSMVVGKPVSQLLLAENATVTVCHSRTRDLPAMTRQADVLVAAIGRPGFIGAAHVKPGAIVIDVGTTPDADGKLVGDVDFAAVRDIAGALTPVPGGVGPVTTALLLRHTVSAATPRAV